MIDASLGKSGSDQTVVIVLGMHRSGTSCLTGLLQQAGLELGDVVREAPHNRKGNRENLQIRSLNDEVLSSSNGSWSSPPRHLAWLDSHERQRDEIIASHASKPAWGFKDPRVVFTLPFWQAGLRSADLRYIGTFRHPLSVAKSLNARQVDISIEQGVALWIRYNERLLEYRQRYVFPVVDFDLEPEPYLRSVAAAMDYLCMPTTPETGLDFFDDGLRRHRDPNGLQRTADAQAVESALPLYGQLKAFA